MKKIWNALASFWFSTFSMVLHWFDPSAEIVLTCTCGYDTNNITDFYNHVDTEHP